MIPFIQDTFISLINSLGLIVLYVSIIVIALEVLKAFNWLDKINQIIYPLTKHLGISKSASMPLLIGFIFGITYGSGAILKSYHDGEMNKRDILLVVTFHSLSHAMIEDTLLMWRIGANLYIIMLSRLIFATIATLILNKLLIFLDIKRK